MTAGFERGGGCIGMTIWWGVLALGPLFLIGRAFLRWQQDPTPARLALLVASFIVPAATLLLGWLTNR